MNLNIETLFYYANKTVEILQNFKYLGIVFSFNGKNVECMKDIITRAQRAMFSISKRVLNLPIDIQLTLFDSMATSILLYACEKWGNENIAMIEKLYIRYCKYVLHLKTSNPNLYGTGRIWQRSDAFRNENSNAEVLE